MEGRLLLVGARDLAADEAFGQLGRLGLEHGDLLAQEAVLGAQAAHLLLVLLLLGAQLDVVLLEAAHALGAVLDGLGGAEEQLGAGVETGRHLLLEVLERALHVEREQVVLAEAEDGQRQPEDGLHAVDEEQVHDAAGQRQRQRRRQQRQEPAAGVHRRVQRLRHEVRVQLRQLFLRRFFLVFGFAFRFSVFGFAFGFTLPHSG